MDREHFETHGWVRLPGAFGADDAAAMRDVTWRALETVGIRRDDPSTWRKERPDHLQHLKKDPAFSAVGTEATRAAIDEAMRTSDWRVNDWGAFFLVFPTPGRAWDVPSTGWHVDADYAGSLDPPTGVKVHAMYGDVAPRAGGMNIVSGSHRLLRRWFEANPPPTGGRSAHLRKAVLRGIPYLRDLCTESDPAARIERFHDRVEDVDGVPVQVLENTAAAGDVILMHSLLLHAPPAAHTGTHPRFLLNKDIWR